ncbi:MAG: hypothetical protein WAU88_13300 [Candidatus Zixiibacteriota bacterium]
MGILNDAAIFYRHKIEVIKFGWFDFYRGLGESPGKNTLAAIVFAIGAALVSYKMQIAPFDSLSHLLKTLVYSAIVGSLLWGFLRLLYSLMMAGPHLRVLRANLIAEHENTIASLQNRSSELDSEEEEKLTISFDNEFNGNEYSVEIPQGIKSLSYSPNFDWHKGKNFSLSLNITGSASLGLCTCVLTEIRLNGKKLNASSKFKLYFTTDSPDDCEYGHIRPMITDYVRVIAVRDDGLVFLPPFDRTDIEQDDIRRGEIPSLFASEGMYSLRLVFGGGIPYKEIWCQFEKTSDWRNASLKPLPDSPTV